VVVGQLDAEAPIRRLAEEERAKFGLELRQALSEQVRCGSRARQLLRDHLVDGALEHAAVGNDHDFGAYETGGAKDGRLVAGARVPYPLARAPVGAEVAPHQFRDGRLWRRREVGIGGRCDSVLSPAVDVDCHSAWLEHPEHRGRQPKEPLATQPHGMRQFSVLDPWDNRITFAEPVR
jgi:hypothetical protein